MTSYALPSTGWELLKSKAAKLTACVTADDRKGFLSASRFFFVKAFASPRPATAFWLGVCLWSECQPRYSPNSVLFQLGAQVAVMS